MQDPQITIDTKLTDLETDAWLGCVDDLCDSYGFFEQLGERHFAAFLKAGRKLLITFEDIEAVRAFHPGAEPRGFAYARHDGWSHLALLSKGESWFRDPAVYDFFDRLTDEGFYDDFDKVIFHGADGGGYAAAAYSVSAPGATVIALRPQATLEASITGWDKRYAAQRRTSFTDRYGYAPDMAEAADKVFIAYDPIQDLDAIHAMLFKNANVTLLPCTLLGTRLDVCFDRLGIHDLMLKLAMDDALDARRFALLLRARRYDQTYARALVNYMLRNDHERMAKIVCRYMLQRSENAYFSKMLSKIGESEAA